MISEMLSFPVRVKNENTAMYREISINQEAAKTRHILLSWL